MSQSPLLPPEGCLSGDTHGLLLSLPAIKKQGHTVVNESLKDCCNAPETDLHSNLESITLQSQPQPVEPFSVTQGQCCENGNVHAMDLLVPSDCNGKPESQFSSTNGFAESVAIPTATFGVSAGNDGGVDHSLPGRKESGSIDDVNPPRNNGAISSHAAKPLIPSLGKMIHEPQCDRNIFCK